MAVLPKNSSSLELTISMPGFDSSPSLPSSGELGGVRNLDINQIPKMEEEEEEWMMITTRNFEDQEESSINGGPPRKKLRLSKDQSHLLEESFRLNHTLNPKQKEALAMELQLKPRQVEVWFQNRRARSKLKQTEMECEYLKRWFGSLTEQNRRLRWEVEELRAVKVASPAVISPHSREPLPASTITMCPQCGRLTTATVHKTSATTTTATTATVIAMSSKVVLPALKSRQPSAAC